MFALHFVCLVNYGDGASFMSPEFQATLQHSNMISNVPADVVYGSEIILRHVNTNGGYLHSHDHMYETGSKQQQVTLYPHKDDNNIWIVENATAIDDRPDFTTSPVYVNNGDIIRLRHKATHRRLHSHDHRPPVTEQDHQNEVSCYGFEGFPGDANDNFRVEILDEKTQKGEARRRLRTLESRFRLVHTITGCVLFSHDVKLPKWAFEQQEVTCIKGGKLHNQVFFIEQNSSPLLPEDSEKVSYRVPSFFEKFIELNKVMWKVNAGLTDSHTWDSRPDSWPLLKRGINFWVKDHRQIYLLGNGIIWWTITGLIVAYCVWKGVWLLRWQRGFNDFAGDVDYATFDSGFGSYVLAWAFHYFPSYLMARQLFLHHYLGALYFGILALAQFWEFFVARVVRNKIINSAVTVLFFSAAVAWYLKYAPLAYAGSWTKDLCEKSKFLDMDFDCVSFHDTYDEYKDDDKPKSSLASTEVPATPVPTSDVSISFESAFRAYY
jgi:dolichyl-phosphate-mannose-protein mannosyltransferase